MNPEGVLHFLEPLLWLIVVDQVGKLSSLWKVFSTVSDNRVHFEVGYFIEPGAPGTGVDTTVGGELRSEAKEKKEINVTCLCCRIRRELSNGT